MGLLSNGIKNAIFEVFCWAVRLLASSTILISNNNQI